MNHNHSQNYNKKDHNLESVKSDGVVYTCPMHPEIKQDKPGMCPECGMKLVPMKKTHEIHDKHAGHSTEMFLKKFWVSLILTIPVVLFHWAFSFHGSGYLSLILSSIVFFYGGWVFLIGAWREIQGKLPGMMTLIGIAISAAYLWSIYAVFTNEEALFWELTTLITIMLLGHWLEMRAVSGAQGALKELSKLLPDTAEVIRGNTTEIINLSQLKENDIVLVKPGLKIPADGVAVEGDSDVNEAMITGESKLVSKHLGSIVIAGTINGDGALKIKVSNIGEKTFLAGVMRLVTEAQASKSRLQVLSDRAAFYLTIIAVGGGIITLVSWLISGSEVSFAVARLVAVLVITCPHALGLAVPLVASISTTKAAQNGFLVKQRLALEEARKIDIVLFDKTGTLTKGEFGITDILPLAKYDKKEILGLAASIDVYSEHPIAKAIVSEAKKNNLPLNDVKKYETLKGRGAKGLVNDKEIAVGGLSLLEEKYIVIPYEISKQIDGANKRGETTIFILKDGLLVGAISLADVIREESREAIRELKEMGIKTSMITGDSDDVASFVSTDLGIDEYFARVLPHQKSEKVKDLQKRGLKVAMVGDGINDAPALTQADLGIAIGAGTNVAIESAGIILVRNDPRDIVKIINLSRMTYVKMIQNLWWATGYNIVAMPLAAGVLAFRGIILDPSVSALLMSVSTIIVAFNAILLKNRKL